MKTRFTPLVKIKKNLFDKSERQLAKANLEHQKAQEALERALYDLHHNTSLTSGTMSDMLQQRQILQMQRNVVVQSRTVVERTRLQVEAAKKELRNALMQYEKFKYLETQEVEAILLKQAKAEQKMLDESALHGFMLRQEHV